jgi:hypothetical protein
MTVAKADGPKVPFDTVASHAAPGSSLTSIACRQEPVAFRTIHRPTAELVCALTVRAAQSDRTQDVGDRQPPRAQARYRGDLACDDDIPHLLPRAVEFGMRNPHEPAGLIVKLDRDMDVQVAEGVMVVVGKVQSGIIPQPEGLYDG